MLLILLIFEFFDQTGIELAEKIKKGQFKVGTLGGRTARMPEIWQFLRC